MPKRRGNKDGSIFKRKDGRWCAQITIQSQRQTQPAFNPNGSQRILPVHDPVFALVRTAPDDEAEMVLCLIDVSGRSHTITIDPVEWDLPGAASWRDLISGEVYSLQEGCLCLAIGDYQTLWLKPV